MCIRDSKYTQETDKVTLTCPNCMDSIFRVNTDGSLTGPAAVSYTHLDVYKRQVISFACESVKLDESCIYLILQQIYILARHSCTQVDATNSALRPSTKQSRTQHPCFCARMAFWRGTGPLSAPTDASADPSPTSPSRLAPSLARTPTRRLPSTSPATFSAARSIVIPRPAITS